jgi:hypothetical protein
VLLSTKLITPRLENAASGVLSGKLRISIKQNIYHYYYFLRFVKTEGSSEPARESKQGNRT